MVRSICRVRNTKQRERLKERIKVTTADSVIENKRAGLLGLNCSKREGKIRRKG